jgi:replicative DNA helicase
MGQVVKALKTDRLVAIMGSPGVGKSAVCRNSVNFVADRNYFAAGVLFFSLKGTLNCEILMKQLLSKMLI